LPGTACSAADLVREIRDEVEDVIGGRSVADVASIVRIVGCQENHRPRSGVLLAAVDGELEVAILDKQDFFPGMAVDGVGFHAWFEGGDVNFELIHGDGGIRALSIDPMVALRCE
jgi:hypothetical protein